MGNAFSFDDSEFADQPENQEEDQQQDAADEALAGLEQSPAGVEDEDPALQDVDLRLEIADYYRAILKHPFFDTTNAAAKLVDTEIRGFIRERLEVLLGLRNPTQPEVVLQFTDDEARALKIIAAKVNGKPALVAPVGPSVNKMQAPAAKKPVMPAVRAKPTVRKIPAPPPAPSTKPQPKPVVAKKVEQKPAPKAQAAKPAAPKKAAPKQQPTTGDSQTYVNPAGQTITLVEGEVIEENGRKYKVVRNEAGTLFRKDITGQVVAPGRIPPMSVQQMSIMSQQQAEAQLASLDDTTGIAIVASLTKQE